MKMRRIEQAPDSTTNQFKIDVVNDKGIFIETIEREMQYAHVTQGAPIARGVRAIYPLIRYGNKVYPVRYRPTKKVFCIVLGEALLRIPSGFDLK